MISNLRKIAQAQIEIFEGKFTKKVSMDESEVNVFKVLTDIALKLAHYEATKPKRKDRPRGHHLSTDELLKRYEEKE